MLSGFSAGIMLVRTASAVSAAFWPEVALVAHINSQVHARRLPVTDFAVIRHPPVD